MEENLIMYF